MKNSIKVVAALVAILVTIMTLATATAFAFHAIRPISALLAVLVIPFGAAIALSAAIMIAAYADSKLG